MINIIFKKTNLLTASLLVISVVSCGKPYEYTPSNNSKYPVRYPTNYNSTYNSLKDSSKEISSLSNQNIQILNNLITALKSYQTINKVSTQRNAKFIQETSDKLEKIKNNVESMNTNNKILYSQIPTAITPASLNNDFLSSIKKYHSNINIKEINDIKSELLSIFNDSNVIKYIGQTEINDITGKINKLRDFSENNYTLDSYIELFSNYAR